MSNDARFFQSQRRGEIAEWRAELRSTDLATQKQAIKKVIAAMTVGKDVSGLFPDVLQCMQTTSLELKKLIYLYLINYAKSKPELTILAVNTFIKDAQDPNPLVRALAVRTMGCIRVHRITEYLCDPLQVALTDTDPYVRKSAVICVAKLFGLDQELVESRGFIEMLKDVIYSENNATVLSNALASLFEISKATSKQILTVDARLAQRLTEMLTACTEWGQVYILSALEEYTASSHEEAVAIIQRVSAHLQHSNGAVVLASMNVLARLSQTVSNSLQQTIRLQIASSMVTLLGSELEIQYITLHTVHSNLSVYKCELQRNLEIFFCKYNDPYYIKHEKLKILLQLVSDETVSQVLAELKEYSAEVDLEFVRQAIRAIGTCAIQFRAVARDAVTILLQLIESKINYVVQEAIIVMKDIFRAYPDHFEYTLPTLCEGLTSLDRPEAKAALIWIVGEYAGRIENASSLIETFSEMFADEPETVQLQLLTTSVKTFIQLKDSRSQHNAQHVLRKASSCENPDVRDRAFIYWRLLSSNSAQVQNIVSLSCVN